MSYGTALRTEGEQFLWRHKTTRTKFGRQRYLDPSVSDSS